MYGVVAEEKGRGVRQGVDGLLHDAQVGLRQVARADRPVARRPLVVGGRAAGVLSGHGRRHRLSLSLSGPCLTGVGPAPTESRDRNPNPLLAKLSVTLSKPKVLCTSQVHSDYSQDCHVLQFVVHVNATGYRLKYKVGFVSRLYSVFILFFLTTFSV